MSNSLRPHGLQHTRLPCPSPTPGPHSNSCPSNQWCHPTILASVGPFSSSLQSFLASGSFPESVLCIRWLKYWSFSFSISPSNDYSFITQYPQPTLLRLFFPGRMIGISNFLSEFFSKSVSIVEVISNFHKHNFSHEAFFFKAYNGSYLLEYRPYWQLLCFAWKVKVLFVQSCPTLCNPMDCSLAGSSAHGILHARILEWIAISLSMGPSQPRDQTQVSWIAGRYFTVWIPRESIPYVLASAFQFQKFVFVDVKIQKTIKHNYCLQNFIIYSTIKIIKEKPQIAKIREYYFT